MKEEFRKISEKVGKYAKDERGNPYEYAVNKVKDFANNDINRLMWLKSESELSSYDNIMNAAITILLALIAVMNLFWNVFELYDKDYFLIGATVIIYGITIFVFIYIIADVHRKYRLYGIGDKYVKLAIDNLINEYQNK